MRSVTVTVDTAMTACAVWTVDLNPGAHVHGWCVMCMRGPWEVHAVGPSTHWAVVAAAVHGPIKRRSAAARWRLRNLGSCVNVTYSHLQLACSRVCISHAATRLAARLGA